MSTLKESRKRSACKDESQVWNSATAPAVCLQMSSVFWFESLIRLKHIQTYWDIDLIGSGCSSQQEEEKVHRLLGVQGTDWYRLGTDSAPIRHRWSQNSTTQRAGWVSDSVRQCQIVWVSFASYFWYFCSYVLCYLRPGRKLTVADSSWQSWLHHWHDWNSGGPTFLSCTVSVSFATLL